jgi:phosphinothricin acetyltransferase
VNISPQLRCRSGVSGGIVAVTIRLASADDAVAIAGIYRPYVEHSRISFETEAPNAGEIVQRMTNPIHPWLVAEDDGRVIGYASTSPMRNRAAYRWSVETGIYLAGDAQGRGIGRQLLQAHLDLLERQGFVTAIAGISLPNEASVALHEKLGFTLSGIERGVGFKFDEWVDVGRWQRDLAPRSAAPAEPRPFGSIGVERTGQ